MDHIIISSHPRSGTHFFINTIGINSEYKDAGSRIMPLNIPIFTISEMMKKNPERIIKSHHQAYSFNNSNKRYLYIYRNGRDVMLSCYRLWNNKFKWKKAKTIMEFMKHPLPPNETVFKCAVNKPATILDSWVNHIEAFIENIDLFRFYVSYEELIDKYYTTTINILNSLEISLPQTIVKPSKYLHVLNPGAGIIGAYKEVFTDEENDYFLNYTSVIRDKMKEYGLCLKSAM